MVLRRPFSSASNPPPPPPARPSHLASPQTRFKCLPARHTGPRPPPIAPTGKRDAYASAAAPGLGAVTLTGRSGGSGVGPLEDEEDDDEPNPRAASAGLPGAETLGDAAPAAPAMVDAANPDPLVRYAGIALGVDDSEPTPALAPPLRLLLLLLLRLLLLASASGAAGILASQSSAARKKARASRGTPAAMQNSPAITCARAAQRASLAREVAARTAGGSPPKHPGTTSGEASGLRKTARARASWRRSTAPKRSMT